MINVREISSRLTDREIIHTTKQKRYNQCNAIESKAEQAKQRPKKGKGINSAICDVFLRFNSSSCIALLHVFYVWDHLYSGTPHSKRF